MGFLLISDTDDELNINVFNIYIYMNVSDQLLGRKQINVTRRLHLNAIYIFTF